LSLEGAIAVNRFGLGARPGEVERASEDPKAWLTAQIGPARQPLQADGTPFKSGAQLVADLIQFRRERRDARQANDTEAAKAFARQQRQVLLDEMGARFDLGFTTTTPFAERLVWFWNNHFTISTQNAQTASLAGAYEREAIRPHVLGKFADLLLAAESHPAMLIYLNNSSSMGPNSVAGINRNRGINENLGREILELHTLGVRGGYHQDDVISLAKAITGWTIYDTATNPDHGGEFLYFPRLHEPGREIVLGKPYSDMGQEQGRAVLADLARHPATAEHVATKLARHFIADEPPPALIEVLTKTFLDTDGDLLQVSKALVMAPESWSSAQSKIKHPSEWMVTYIRAAGLDKGDARRMVPALNRLGEPLWRPAAPKGFGDGNDDWLDGVGHRLDTANAVAQNYGDRLDPKAMLETSLGPLASAETRSTVTRAETKQQAITLLLMAPEMQRR
jgi:uncharacterized protein (DUF1800 family)